MIGHAEGFAPRLDRRKRWGAVVHTVYVVAVWTAVAVLAVLLIQVAVFGWEFLSSKFLTNYPSVLNPENSGVKSALYGSVWVLVLTAAASIPVGIGAAIYLEEYARGSHIARAIQVVIANLAGVPSIVYGILGLAIFVRWMHMGRSILAGSLTLALLILPVIIIASREALAAVPDSIRQAAFGLGATRWQTIRSHVLPSASPGIATGVILALSRAIGETAPLIMIGGLTFVAFTPDGPMDAFTVLPLQIYNWCDQPQPEFHRLAATAILVLLGVLLSMNALAVGIRLRRQRKQHW